MSEWAAAHSGDAPVVNFPSAHVQGSRDPNTKCDVGRTTMTPSDICQGHWEERFKKRLRSQTSPFFEPIKQARKGSRVQRTSVGHVGHIFWI